MLSDSSRNSLFLKSKPAVLGSAAAFVSHAWNDDANGKLAALREFVLIDGVSDVWIDKACINQDDIDESLAALPIFLSGCKKILVILSP